MVNRLGLLVPKTINIIMKFREILEDGDAAGTVSADIATVAYPLFVRGRNRKEKRANARRAVGQKPDNLSGVIGRGVFENAETLNVGDPVIIVGNVQFKGKTGDIDSFGKDKRFVVVNLYNYGLHSFHSSDVEYNDYADQDIEEAHVLDHQNVIYRLDREKPMSDTEVLVLGGAGRYSLEALRNKARREADQLAQDLKIEHGGAFRRSAENIKQLTNTLNTIVAAYNELKRIRSKGGRGSRGITDEDANFIRECMSLVQRALKEGVAVEPDASGYEKTKLTSPQFAVVVDTPSDYDWYKIGNHWHDRVIDPHEFGQEDSDTVMVGYGERDFNNMLAKLDQMGFTYKLIGGTHSQPEIHKGNKR